jgi:WD40 repeat protein
LLLDALYPKGQGFSADLTRMAAVALLARVYVHDVETGRESRFIETRGEQVEWAAISPDGKRLAVCQRGKSTKITLPDGRPANLPAPYYLRLRDAETGDLIKETEIPGSYFGALAFSPDGTLLATSVRRPEGTIFVYNSATGKELVRLHSGNAFALSLAISPDNKTLYSGMSDTSVLVWDLPK